MKRPLAHAVTAVLAWLPIPAALAADPPRKPNVLFIVADDLNTQLGCFGAPVRTPNVDRLAARGVRFNHAFCQYPLCNPSRASFMTGLRPDTTGILDNTQPARTHLGPDHVFMPEHFKSAGGYFTARFGKINHVDHAPKWKVIAWDLDAKTLNGNSGGEDAAAAEGVVLDGDAAAPKSHPWAPAQPAKGKPTWSSTPVAGEGSDLADAVNARMARDFLANRPSPDQPFFLAMGFYRPHLPWIAPRKYFEMYPPDSIKLPTDEPANDRDDIPKMALTYASTVRPMAPDERQRFIATYYAVISFMDAQLGVLLDELDRQKLWDNTYVVFLGDHGYHLGEHGLQRKRSLFEQSAGAPLIVAGPGLAQGASSDALVEFCDIYPTLTELAGLPAPANLEATSFAPVLRKPDLPWKKAALTVVTRENGKMGRTVRTPRWRYTEWDDAKAGVELYDHDADPREYTNLANDPKHADTIADLKTYLAKDGWRRALPE